MASSSSTDPQTQNNNSNSPGRKDKDDRDPDKPDEGKKGAATYYGAVVIVVFVSEIFLTSSTRFPPNSQMYMHILKKYRKRNPEIDELDPEVVEQDERLAMERRGEEVGLPTYRESTVVRNNETVLASTPITSTPFARENETTTYPLEDHDETAQPPKYEDDASGTARPTPNPPSSLDINNEMRMSTLSAATLVVPTIADHRAIGHENSQSSNPPSSPPPPLTPPPPASLSPPGSPPPPSSSSLPPLPPSPPPGRTA
ncbi:hypothetical protein PSTT_02703 [Puccinia striiformis]|uniref:Uncharacterized protein n=1 Tax=Puccinia striiformis TaxID=27350 RepID=A0A2S4VZ53_9BASI|nr:hypothetical protein PSTT_02703 [Puccinia striiformis]